MLPALIILALWVALLTPGVVRWLREHRQSGSIALFHRQLRLLEVSGPKLLAAAHHPGGDGQGDQTTRRARERPQLVLLRTGANDKEHLMRYDGRDDRPRIEPRATPAARSRGRHLLVEEPYDEPWLDDDLEAAPMPATRAHRAVRAPAYDPFEEEDEGLDEGVAPPRAPRVARRQHRAMTASRARTRRTRVLGALSATIAVSFLLGLVPELTILWVLTVLGVIALGMYLGLMYYASSTGMYGATEQRRPVARAVVPALPEAHDDEEWAPEYYAAAR